jgi:transposase
MMRTAPEQRRLIAEAVKRGKDIKVVADVFGVCIRTVKRWCKRKRFKDKRRKAKRSKVTVKVELSILALRSLEWGTERRVTWIQEHLDEMLAKYDGLSPEKQAYRIVFFDHMRINPEHSKMVRVFPRKIKIESYNFCPYLEASKQLGLETKFVCKEIGEPSIQEIIGRVNPNLRFSRNYQNIRPYNGAFCEEYVELL